MDWLDLLAVQGTLKNLLQHHSSKASVLRCSAFFTVQLSHPYMTTGKTIALTRWTFVGKVMSLLFNMLSGLVITFLPRSKHLLISWGYVNVLKANAQQNVRLTFLHFLFLWYPVLSSSNFLVGCFEFQLVSVYVCCFFSVIQLCSTLCDPMDCNIPGLPVSFTISRILL